MAFYERIEPDIDASGSTFLFGIMGWGQVGRISLLHMIDLLKAARVGECSTPALPIYLLSEANGFGKPPCFEYYFSGKSVPKVFMATGDVTVNAENRRHFYGTLEHVVSLAKEMGASRMITIDGIPGGDGERVKVFASRPSLAKKSALGEAEILRSTFVGSYSGIVVGLARMYDLDAVGVTVPCANPATNRQAGLIGFRYLVDLIDLSKGPD